MKLWHDDCRRPPDDSWSWVRTNDDAKLFLRSHPVEVISMDHDLGLHDLDPDHPNADFLVGKGEEDGVRLADWMIVNHWCPPLIVVHSMNPVGAGNIVKRFQSAGHKAVHIPFDPACRVSS